MLIQMFIESTKVTQIGEGSQLFRLICDLVFSCLIMLKAGVFYLQIRDH